MSDESAPRAMRRIVDDAIQATVTEIGGDEHLRDVLREHLTDLIFVSARSTAELRAFVWAKMMALDHPEFGRPGYLAAKGLDADQLTDALAFRIASGVRQHGRPGLLELWAAEVLPRERTGESSTQDQESQGERVRLIAILACLSVVIAGAVAILTIQLIPSDSPGWTGTAADIVISGASVLASVSVIAATLPWWLRRMRRKRRTEGSRQSAGSTVESRIEEVTHSLQVTAALVKELQSEIQARTTALERLRVQNDEYEKLASLRKDEAEAVSRLIEDVISNAHARLGRSSRRDQVLFFAAGLAASVPVQIIVTWISRS